MIEAKKKEARVMLGAWAWGAGAAGGDQVFGVRRSEADLRAVFGRAMGLGLNMWDTAAVYGEGSSERILGSFVKDVQRSGIFLSTKFTPQIAEDSPEAMRKMLEGSMRRLNVEYIDLYWIHNPMDVERWTPQLVPIAKEGLIKSIGVSNHNLAQIKRAQEILSEAGLKISAVQNHFSLLHRSSERAGILDHCRKNGMIFYSYMVLEQGALSGKYGSSHPFPEGSTRAACYNSALPKLEKLVALMRSLGEARGASPSQIAIAWALAKDTTPIVGVTEAEQAEEAAKAALIELTADECALLEKLGDDAGVSALREWESEM